LAGRPKQAWKGALFSSDIWASHGGSSFPGCWRRPVAGVIDSAAAECLFAFHALPGGIPPWSSKGRQVPRPRLPPETCWSTQPATPLIPELAGPTATVGHPIRTAPKGPREDERRRWAAV